MYDIVVPIEIPVLENIDDRQTAYKIENKVFVMIRTVTSRSLDRLILLSVCNHTLDNIFSGTFAATQSPVSFMLFDATRISNLRRF